jgi:S1-C subfamily serine protease
MSAYLKTCVLLAALAPALALAEKLPLLPSILPNRIQLDGAPLKNVVKPIGKLTLGGIDDTVPAAQLLQIAQQPVRGITTATRSAKDTEIYRAISPSVVLVATRDGLGSGSLVSLSGDIITNWHVVRGYSVVGILFKPVIEGVKPRSDEMKVGRVIKYDQVPDLALVKVDEIPNGRMPIRLGNSGEISVGADVSAIGHPRGNDWSYTKGIISQYRQGFGWTAGDEKIEHKANVIQTQTPINPGNSGGPLISESGTLIGVNTVKADEGEGLNFAVAVDDVKRFLVEPSKTVRQGSKNDCEPREISRFRSKANDAAVISYDMNCSGKANAQR